MRTGNAQQLAMVNPRCYQQENPLDTKKKVISDIAKYDETPLIDTVTPQPRSASVFYARVQATKMQAEKRNRAALLRRDVYNRNYNRNSR